MPSCRPPVSLSTTTCNTTLAPCISSLTPSAPTRRTLPMLLPSSLMLYKSFAWLSLNTSMPMRPSMSPLAPLFLLVTHGNVFVSDTSGPTFLRLSSASTTFLTNKALRNPRLCLFISCREFSLPPLQDSSERLVFSFTLCCRYLGPSHAGQPADSSLSSLRTRQQAAYPWCYPGSHSANRLYSLSCVLF